jgi:SAM-dependent methyltransferase
LPDFTSAGYVDSDQTVYFRDDYHERWRREQAQFDADPRHVRYRSICLDKVLAHLPPGRAAQVLDAGSGLGHFLKRLPVEVDAHATDLSRGNLRYLQQDWTKEHDGAHLWNAPIEALPFANSQFDVVYSFSVLWYVAAWRRAVEEMCRVTRPGGTVVFDFHNGWSPWHRWHAFYTHVRRAVQPSRGGIMTFAPSPTAVMSVLRRAGVQVTVEGYYVLLPTRLPPFRSYGQLAQRSDVLAFNFARSPLRWTGAKLLVIGRKTA